MGPGDTNYRLSAHLSSKEVHSAIDSAEFDKLLEHDELRAAMSSGKAFGGYSEAEIK